MNLTRREFKTTSNGLSIGSSRSIIEREPFCYRFKVARGATCDHTKISFVRWGFQGSGMEKLSTRRLWKHRSIAMAWQNGQFEGTESNLSLKSAIPFYPMRHLIHNNVETMTTLAQSCTVLARAISNYDWLEFVTDTSKADSPPSMSTAFALEIAQRFPKTFERQAVKFRRWNRTR